MRADTALTGQEKKKQSRFSLGRILAVLFLILLGTALFLAGYIYIDYRLTGIQEETNRAVSTALKEIQETNALNIKALEESLDSLFAEMEEIKYILRQTDRSIEFSTSTQEALANSINELEQQLKELQKGMELLKDAFDSLD